METVINHERSLGRQVFDVSEKNLGYDVTSLDLASGELRLIEVKGLAAETGIIRLTPNEKRVAEDRRDCYWLYVVTNCADSAVLQAPITDPAAPRLARGQAGGPLLSVGGRLEPADRIHRAEAATILRSRADDPARMQAPRRGRFPDRRRIEARGAGEIAQAAPVPRLYIFGGRAGRWRPAERCCWRSYCPIRAILIAQKILRRRRVIFCGRRRASSVTAMRNCVRRCSGSSASSPIGTCRQYRISRCWSWRL